MNTSSFCDQPAKNAVIYSVFLLRFQKHWYLQCFVHLGSKKYWYLQHFLRFCTASAKTVKRKNAVIYSILCLSKNEKSSEKCVKTALFSDFRYPQNGGRGGLLLLETLMSDPDSGQKALPHPPEGFLVFFGARRRRVGGLGRASP